MTIDKPKTRKFYAFRVSSNIVYTFNAYLAALYVSGPNYEITQALEWPIPIIPVELTGRKLESLQLVTVIRGTAGGTLNAACCVTNQTSQIISSASAELALVEGIKTNGLTVMPADPRVFTQITFRALISTAAPVAGDTFFYQTAQQMIVEYYDN